MTERMKDEGAEGDDLSVFQHSVREFDLLLGASLVVAQVHDGVTPLNSYGRGSARLHMALRWFFYTKEAPE